MAVAARGIMCLCLVKGGLQGGGGVDLELECFPVLLGWGFQVGLDLCTVGIDDGGSL